MTDKNYLIDSLIELLAIETRNATSARAYFGQLDLPKLSTLNAQIEEARKTIADICYADLDAVSKIAKLPHGAYLEGGIIEEFDKLVTIVTADTSANREDRTAAIERACVILGLVWRSKRGEVALMFRTNYVFYYRALSRIAARSKPNPLEHFLLMLANTQSLPEMRALSSLNGMWHRLAEAAGTRSPQSFLKIALFGIARSSESENAIKLDMVLSALLSWIGECRPQSALIVEEFQFARMLFKDDTVVHDERFWRRSGEAILIAHQSRIDRDAMYCLRDLLGIRVHHVAARVQPSVRARGEFLLRSFDTYELSELLIAVHGFSEAAYRFALQTSDDSVLGRTNLLLGRRILEHPNFSNRPEAAMLVCELALDGIRWQPRNVKFWILWRNALRLAGRSSASEIVGWEAKRRFPDNAPMWCNLAKHIEGQGRMEEAEALLSECVFLFPQYPLAYTQLARLIASSSTRREEAIDLLRQGIAATGNVNVLARLLNSLDKNTLKNVSSSGPTTIALSDSGLISSSPNADTESMECFGKATRADFWIRHPHMNLKARGIEELRELTDQHGFAYARYLLAREKGAADNPQKHESNWFALALANAIREPSGIELASLVNRAKGDEQTIITRTAMAAFANSRASLDQVAVRQTNNGRIEGRLISVIDSCIKTSFGAKENIVSFVDAARTSRERALRLFELAIQATLTEDVAA